MSTEKPSKILLNSILKAASFLASAAHAALEGLISSILIGLSIAMNQKSHQPINFAVAGAAPCWPPSCRDLHSVLFNFAPFMGH